MYKSESNRTAMEFPSQRNHQHQHHQHHQRDDDDDDDERQNYPYPPPPGASFEFDQPPPRPNTSYYGIGGEDQPLPLPQPYSPYGGEDQPPPPPYSHYGGEDQPPPPRPRPPQSSYYEAEADRPPYPPTTQVSHVSHSFHGDGGHGPPPPRFQSQGYFHQQVQPPVHSSFNCPSSAPTLPPVTVHQVAHQFEYDQQQSAPPCEVGTHHHTSHTSSHLPDSYFSNKPTFRVFAKADPSFSLSIREGKVILARSHATDDSQHWYKDEKYATSVKDEERFPSFALINKATGQALKHSIGATHPVQVIPYNPDVLDESILWTESADLGDGFRTVRMVNNIRFNLDAFHGDKKSGGVHDGTTIVLWNKNKGDNQRWKIVPY